MMYKNLYDFHSHSIYSFDGVYACEEMVKAALKNGFKGIAITDHFDIGEEYEQYDEFDDEKQFNDVIRCKQKYSDKINVYAGIEVGQGIHDKKRCEALLNKHDYDFVLGSLHNLRNTRDFYYLEYNEDNVDVLLDKYFDELTELCNWNKFDSLAHLTYPIRYITGKYNIDVDLGKYEDKIETILKILVSNGKALEINTARMYKEIYDTIPTKSIIKMFKDLGGKYVTVGSDGHFTNNVCLGVEDGMKIAKSAGFDFITIYEQRKPILISIE